MTLGKFHSLLERIMPATMWHCDAWHAVWLVLRYDFLGDTFQNAMTPDIGLVYLGASASVFVYFAWAMFQVNSTALIHAA